MRNDAAMKRFFEKELNRVYDETKDYEDGCALADWGEASFDFPLICLKYRVHIRSYNPQASQTLNYQLAYESDKPDLINDVRMVTSNGYPHISNGVQTLHPTIYCHFVNQNHYNLLVPKEKDAVNTDG